MRVALCDLAQNDLSKFSMEKSANQITQNHLGIDFFEEKNQTFLNFKYLEANFVWFSLPSNQSPVTYGSL